MKRFFIAAIVMAICAVIFSFTIQHKKKTLDHKWFKYRTGDTGVPAANASNAKVASYYVLNGDDPFCEGSNEYCGIFAEPTDATPSALPIISTAEQNDIDDYFDNPSTYSGNLVDRTIE